jgi:diacylglycerol kinase family enzyme
MLTGGFGCQVTAETDPALKRRLGGLAYALTGLLRIGDLAASAGVFRDENFEWDGAFNALAIWQRPGRPHHLLDLTIMPHLPPGERPET